MLMSCFLLFVVFQFLILLEGTLVFMVCNEMRYRNKAYDVEGENVTEITPGIDYLVLLYIG